MITFVLFTSNEESRIELALRNFAGWGELLVIDNYSTDQTVEIVRRYTDNIVFHRNSGHVDDAATYQVVCQNARTDWVYRGFAGEAVPYELLVEMSRITQSEGVSVVRIAKRNISYGVETRNWALGYHPRLARKTGISFDGCGIHALGRIIASSRQVVTLPRSSCYCIYQFRDYNVELTAKSFASYIKLDVGEAYATKSVRFSPVRQILLPLYVFITSYTRRWAFLQGWPAFYNAIWNGRYQFDRQAALWELTGGHSIEAIRDRHQEMREKMIQKAHLGLKRVSSVYRV